MANFRRYNGNERFLDVEDHNAKTEALERLLLSAPSNSIVEGGRILTRRVVGGFATLELIAVRLTAHTALRSVNIAIGGSGSTSVEVAWKYSGTETRYNTGTGQSTDPTSPAPRTWTAGNAVGHATSPPLFNLAELNATTAIVAGITMNTANYPTGNRPRPVDASGTSNTHAWEPVVHVWKATNSDGAEIWVFDRLPVHDGSCT